MSERKVLNKYYPPDFDPSKIPRLKQARNRQYTVRLMAPFNMRCVTCGEYIYKGKKFNARKEDVENEDYLGIRIYRFYIKCTRCLQEISFKTDPRNTDYEIEAGATRNFMALKRAEEQAEREQQEIKEEEANNPMKQLENRTQQSRNEIELLESLEELKDLNRRQQSVDYDTMLQQYDKRETAKEREERIARLDEEYIKTIKFGAGVSNGLKKVVLSEEIIELNEENDNEDEEDSDSEPATKIQKLEDPLLESTSIIERKKVVSQSVGVRKTLLSGLVKKKVDTVENKKIVESVKENKKVEVKTAAKNDKPNGLSLLGCYSDSDSNDE